MPESSFSLKYHSVVGFHTDQGSRGFQHPSAFAMRSDGRIFVGSRGPAPTTGIQMVGREFEFYGKIGEKGSSLGLMQEVSALAVDEDDNLYVADEELNRITVFDKEGEPVRSWGEHGSQPGQFSRPAGLLLDSDSVFVVDTMNHRVQRYSKEGKFLSQWGQYGSQEGMLDQPWGISRGNDNEFIIADWGNDRIQKFTPDGEHIKSIGESGKGDGQLNRPAHAVVDGEGNMYIADWGNQRLQVLDPEGNFLDSQRGSADLNPWALEYFEAQQDEKLARSSYVPVYEPDTDEVREISARMEPYFWDPCAVMVDSENRVYVLETCRHRFQIFERA